MIVHDDCFNYLKEIKNKSIDLILVDPPYLISKSSNFKNYSDKANSDIITKYGKHSIDFGEWDKEDIDWNLLFKEYYRILKDGGTLIFFYDIWKSTMIKDIAESNKFKQPRICHWQKTNPVPINSKINYLSNANEYFFTFVKGKKPTFHSEYDNGTYRYPLCHGKERLEHPTQKPLSLIMDLVKKHSNEGDLVLDTFAGTGTTGEACLMLKRNYILIERDENYFSLIKNRLGENKIEINT
jgi:site-specific DNA-methyltransferase (adenine-specific)